MNTTPKGFRETMFSNPYPVTLWPDTNESFAPTPGTAIGIEENLEYGGLRLIVRPDAPVIRKSNGETATWPGNIVYVWARQVSGWREGAQ